MAIGIIKMFYSASTSFKLINHKWIYLRLLPSGSSALRLFTQYLSTCVPIDWRGDQLCWSDPNTERARLWKAA